MKDHEFQALVRDAAETYNRPPEPPLEAMWAAIDAERTAVRRFGDRGRSPRTWTLHALVAATLVIGIGLGRLSSSIEFRNPLAMEPVVVAAAPDVDASAFQYETTRYLGQTAALLIALPSEASAGRANAEFAERAGDLLLTTRLLLDSPASSKPALRVLLEDLELVLAQIVRLQNDRGSLDLVNQAIEQRDVIPRLRTVAADFSAD
jgi:hypothetical protein